MTKNEAGRKIKSVDKTCQILEYLRKEGAVRLSKLANDLDISPGTAHTHLATLREYGFIQQEDERYRLGPTLLPLGEHVRNNSDLFQAAKDQVDQLAEQTGESAHLIIEHDGKLVALYEAFGENAIGVEYHAQKRERQLRHLHCTAAGKAILAQFDDNHLEERFQGQGMAEQTPETITDLDTLRENLAETRERGYAVSDEEQMLGIRAVGAPVLRADRTVAGAISLSGSKSRLQGAYFDEELPELVVEAATVTEVNLQTIKTSA